MLWLVRVILFFRHVREDPPHTYYFFVSSKPYHTVVGRIYFEVLFYDMWYSMIPPSTISSREKKGLIEIMMTIKAPAFPGFCQYGIRATSRVAEAAGKLAMIQITMFVMVVVVRVVMVVMISLW